MKIKWINVIRLILIIVIIICLYNIVDYIIRGVKNSNESKDLNNITEINEVVDNDNTVIITQEDIKESDYYYNYIKMNLMNVEFDKLKEINKDVKGWVTVNGTNINFPFVQAKDNDYYLNHSFKGDYNKYGWVFMDYRNNALVYDKNTILYGHSRRDDTMFGSLSNIVKSDWFTDTNNYIVKVSTEKENTLWQVFSVYHIKPTSDYIQTTFSSDNEYKEFLDMLIKRSVFDFKTSVNKDNKVITLSTCYGVNERVVLHAKLIKKEAK